jgi:hypothetical protein
MIMNRDSYVKECSLRLYEALIAERGIRHIVEIASAIFDNPILVVDNSFKILAHAAPEETSTKMYLEIVENGHFPSSYTKTSIAKDTHIHKKIFFSDSPGIFSDSGSPSRYIAYRIGAEGRPAGFASLLEDKHPFRETDIEIFTVLCKVLSKELNSSIFASDVFKNKYEYFIAEVLNKTIKSSHIPERLSQFDITLKRNCFLIVASWANEKEVKQYHLEYLRDQMKAALPLSMCSIYHNNIISLISTDSEQFLTADAVEALNTYLRDGQLVAGISNRFSDISNLPGAYRQAILSIQEGCRFSGRENYYTFREYGIYRLLDLADEDGILQELLNQEHIKILQYDKEFGTEYTKTLYTYLGYGQKSGKTALELGVHRNTIDYRIERIKELFNISFESEDMLFSLLLSNRIIDYYHRIGHGLK